MATEAQRLIGISLAKIAQSRIRGGVSLHKNLLVATVLQKARYIFMEEAYHMVHGHYIQTNRLMEEKLRQQQLQMQQQQEEEDRNNSEQQQQQQPQHHDNPDNYDNDNIEHFGLNNGNSDSDDNNKTYCDNKENNPPSVSNLIYFDMDTTKFEQKSSEDNSVNNNSNNNNNNDVTTSASSGTKRRREIAEWETEEAVLSILPKRIKSGDNDDSSAYSFSDESDEGDSIYNDESVFYDDAIATLSECIPTTTATATTTITTSKCVPNINSSSGNSTNNNSNNNNNNHQGIDRITSLVSIFSFGNLTRTLSTPDMCSAQAQDSEKLSQRTYLAMTV